MKVVTYFPLISIWEWKDKSRIISLYISHGTSVTVMEPVTRFVAVIETMYDPGWS